MQETSFLTVENDDKAFEVATPFIRSPFEVLKISARLQTDNNILDSKEV